MAKDIVQGLQRLTSKTEKRLFQLESHVLVQPKINGIRALWDGKHLLSRTGKITYDISASHIVEALKSLGKEGVGLDGELYIHGVPLSQLSGMARAERPSPQLQFWVFDKKDLTKTQEERLACLDSLSSCFKNPLKLVQTKKATTIEQIHALYHTFLEEGFEGAVIRLPSTTYTEGKRAWLAYKLKPVHSMELLLVGFNPATTDLHKDTFGSLRLFHPKGGWTVSCSGMTEVQRKALWSLRNQVIGKWVTIAYDELSTEGKPQRLRFVSIREEE